MSYDPNIIETCRTCGRSYAVRPIKNMNQWHFYNLYCSTFCAMPRGRAGQWGFLPLVGNDTVFVYLLDRAQNIYADLRRQQQEYGEIINPYYWFGWLYADARPYQFASEFMDRTERAVFLSKEERTQYADHLFALTNNMAYGGTTP